MGKEFRGYLRLYNYTDANASNNGDFGPHYFFFYSSSLDYFILTQPEVVGETVRRIELDLGQMTTQMNENQGILVDNQNMIIPNVENIMN